MDGKFGNLANLAEALDELGNRGVRKSRHFLTEYIPIESCCKTIAVASRPAGLGRI